MISCCRCQTEYLSSEKSCPNCGYAAEFNGDILLWSSELDDINYKAESLTFLAEQEDNYFWFEARRNLVALCLKRFFPDFSSLLEVGCGTGYLLSGIALTSPNADLYASDVFIEALNLTAKKFLGSPKAPRLMRLDARNIPYRDEFEVIVACDVLEHIDDDSSVLTNFYKATKKGGGLIITVPQHQRLWSRADDDAGHVRRYGIAELRAKIAAAGWNVLFTSSFVSLLLPALIFSRLASKGKNPQFKEMNVSSGLNRLLRGAMTLEYYLIKIGLKFPWGGSRLLVASKPH